MILETIKLYIDNILNQTAYRTGINYIADFPYILIVTNRFSNDYENTHGKIDAWIASIYINSPPWRLIEKEIVIDPSDPNMFNKLEKFINTLCL